MNTERKAIKYDIGVEGFMTAVCGALLVCHVFCAIQLSTEVQKLTTLKTNDKKLTCAPVWIISSKI